MLSDLVEVLRSGSEKISPDTVFVIDTTRICLTSENELNPVCCCAFSRELQLDAEALHGDCNPVKTK